MRVDGVTSLAFPVLYILCGGFFLGLGFYFPPLALIAPCLAKDIADEPTNRSRLVLATVIGCCWSFGAIVGAICFFTSPL